MNEQQITCFVAVAATLSFSGAAQRLYLSQPTVTYQIKSLENELGCRLFERMSHAVALTKEGEAFLPAAENLLRDFETARQTLLGKPGIRIAVPPTVFLREGISLSAWPRRFARRSDWTCSMSPSPNRRRTACLISWRVGLIC